MDGRCSAPRSVGWKGDPGASGRLRLPTRIDGRGRVAPRFRSRWADLTGLDAPSGGAGYPASHYRNRSGHVRVERAWRLRRRGRRYRCGRSGGSWARQAGRSCQLCRSRQLGRSWQRRTCGRRPQRRPIRPVLASRPSLPGRLRRCCHRTGVVSTRVEQGEQVIAPQRRRDLRKSTRRIRRASRQLRPRGRR
jgi:hypothetical protein